MEELGLQLVVMKVVVLLSYSLQHKQKDMHFLYTLTLPVNASPPQLKAIKVSWLVTTFNTFGLQTGSTQQLSLQVLNLFQCRLQGLLSFQSSLLCTLDPQLRITVKHTERSRDALYQVNRVDQ